MSRLTELVARQAVRIDALTLRERAIMFVSLVAALVAATDALVLSPQLATHRALVARTQAQSGEMAALEAKLAAGQVPADSPQQRLRLQLVALQAQRAAVDQDIERRLAEAGGAANLSDLLARVLRRHERLTLMRLDSAAPQPGPAAAAGLPLRRGVDLQIAGRHADLVAYLAEIEQHLPGLRWAEMHIDARTQPPVLGLRVYLPGAGA